MTTDQVVPAADPRDRYVYPPTPARGPLHPTEMAVTGLLAGRAGFTADRLRAYLGKVEANTAAAAQNATMANTAETLALVQDVRTDALNQAYDAVLSSSMPGARFFANRILALMQQPSPLPR